MYILKSLILSKIHTTGLITSKDGDCLLKNLLLALSLQVAAEYVSAIMKRLNGSLHKFHGKLFHLYMGSRTSDNGPSEKRTTSQQRTQSMLRIKISNT